MVLLVALVTPGGAALAGKPGIDPVYVNGNVYYMIGATQNNNPPANVYAHSEELYLVTYPIDEIRAFHPDWINSQGQLTLPSGYTPQCNPCFHPGLPAPFVYHDHVLTGAPGLGTNGTAGAFKSPWKILIVQYSLATIENPGFNPITWVKDIDPAKAAGTLQMVTIADPSGNLVTLPTNEIEPHSLLICPFVSPSA
jgi:hypothetical protein